MAEPDCRFVLLTGPPGSGKSTFVAQLARDHPEWPVYFSRFDQRTPLGDAGARGILLDVGFQLAAAHPELFDTEHVEVVVEQRIGTTGDAIGAEIGRVLASPFHQHAIRIRQDVGAARGRVVGASIAELVEDPGRLTLDQLEQMALREPAAALALASPKQRLVVLVDGLDELRYRASGEPVLDWLSGAHVPANVRFVLTSRPADHAVRAFQAKRERETRTLTLAEADPRVLRDAVEYARALAASDVLAQRLTDAGDFTRRVAARAHGNLGYLDALARGIEHAAAAGRGADVDALLALDSLPEELAGLYGFFFSQIRSRLRDDRLGVEDPATGELHLVDRWSAAVKPMLSAMAVAFEPVALAELRRLPPVALDPADLADSFEWLKPYLTATGDRFALYHATLREFLTDPSTEAGQDTASLFVDEQRWHRRIAEVYWRDIERENAPRDEYGLRHVARHLAAAGEDDRLRRLISREWLEELGRRTGGDSQFLDDVEVATARAAETGNLVEHVRLAAVRAVARQRVRRFDDEDLAVLAVLGRAAVARAYARARDRPEAIAAGFEAILRGELAAGSADADAVRELEAVAALVQDDAAHAWLLLAAGELRAALGDPDAPRALAEATQAARAIAARTDRARLMLAASAILDRAGDERAGSLLTETLKLARSIAHDTHAWGRPSLEVELRHRDWMLRDLALTLAEGGLKAEAEDLAAAIEDQVTRARVLVGVVLAHLSDGDLDKAAATAATIEFDLHRENATRLLAGAYAAAGRTDEAVVAVERIGRADVLGPAMVTLVVGLERGGERARAEQLLRDLPSAPDRVEALVAMADEADPPREADLLRRAAEELEPLAGETRADAGWLLALGWARAPDAEAAFEAASDAARHAAGPDAEEDGGDASRMDASELHGLAEELRDLTDVPADPFDLPHRPPAAATADSMLRAIGERLLAEEHVAQAEALLAHIADAGEAAALGRGVAAALAWAQDERAGAMWAAVTASADLSASVSVGPTLAEIGAALADVGDPRADAVFASAVRVTAELPASRRRDGDWEEVCRQLCVAGRFAPAREAAAQVEGEAARTEAHRHLLVGLANGDHLDEAEDEAQRLGFEGLADDARWALAIARLRAGRTADGLEALATLATREARYGAIVGATRTLLEEGEAACATQLPTILGWQDDELIVGAWSQVLAEAEPFDAIGAAVLQISGAERQAFLAAIAAALARKRRTAELEPLLGALDGSVAVDQAAFLAAASLAAAGDVRAAERWSRVVQDAILATLARVIVAGWRARSHPDEAGAALHEAEAAVASLSDEGERVLALPTLSWAVLSADPARADALLDEGVAPIQAERGHPARSLLLLDIAMRLASLGDPRALRVIDTPEEVSLTPLVSALCEAGNIDEALAAARANVNDRDGALDALVVHLHGAAEHDRALTIAREMRDVDARRDAEELAASGLAATGRVAEAIDVVAAHGTEPLLRAVARWGAHFEGQARGNFGAVLGGATGGAGWYQPVWADVHRELVGSGLTPD